MKKRTARLGAHMSIAGGVHHALERGLGIGCEAVQLFVKSSNQWRARDLAAGEVAGFRELAARFDEGCVIGHSSYLINISSPEPELLEKSRSALAVELERCGALGIPWLVLHPGSHRGAGVEAGIETAGDSLRAVLKATAGSGAGILLENTSGAGNILGSSFEELAAMRSAAGGGPRIGFCLDTCHAFAAGYDITTRRGYEKTLREFDDEIGLGLLRAFHLNDSRTPLGSGRDRHANIGKGELGLEPFRLLVNDKRFRGLPMILETPKGPDLKEDVETLALLRSLEKKPKKK